MDLHIPSWVLVAFELLGGAVFVALALLGLLFIWAFKGGVSGGRR